MEAAFQDNQFNLLTNRAKLLAKKLEAYPYRDSEYQYAQYRYLNTIAYYNTHHEDRSKTDSLQELSEAIDKFFLLEKLAQLRNDG
ncbi:MAG: hypothetical protein R2795_05860 [Saprospiraceae bacterium]